MSRRFRAQTIVALGLASAALAGCSRTTDAGTEGVTVTGRLTIGGAPAPRGWVELMPLDGNVGLLRIAPVTSDGIYRATRVPPGAVGIRFTPAGRLPALGSGLDPTLHQLTQAFAIHRMVGHETPIATLDVDLASEALGLISPR
jgi:hypothetical protein